MLDDRGNTAAYLLYAFTRIRSGLEESRADVAVATEWAGLRVFLKFGR